MPTVETAAGIGIREGDCIGGCRIARLLGAGAMGAVYEAHQVSLDRRVAFKILMPRKKVKLDVLRSRFIQEARLAARVNHQNIVQIFDVGEEKGIPYIIMEYAEAVTLKDLLRKHARFPVTRLYRLAVKVARGLAAAHQENVAHRDIKPDNILVTSRGEIKIADFGAAGLAVGNENDQCLIGTPAFMAPEVIRRETSDGRADVYALGLILYTAASGGHPFVEKNVREVLKAQINKPLPPLKPARPALADEFVRLIEKLCSKMAHERYDSSTLVDILEHHPIWENPVGSDVGFHELCDDADPGVGADDPSELLSDDDLSEVEGKPPELVANSAAMTCAFDEDDESGQVQGNQMQEDASVPPASGTLIDVPLVRDNSRRGEQEIAEVVLHKEPASLEEPASQGTELPESKEQVISPIKQRFFGGTGSRERSQPQDPEVAQLCIQARFQIMKKNWKRAEATYRSIVDRDPLNETAIVGLARICAIRGRADEAVDWLRQALENDLVQIQTVQTSREFAPLRELREYRELLVEYSI